MHCFRADIDEISGLLNRSSIILLPRRQDTPKRIYGAIATSAAAATVAGGTSMVASGVSQVGVGASNLWNTPGNIMDGYNSGSDGSGMGHHAGKAYGKADYYLRNKLRGDKIIH